MEKSTQDIIDVAIRQYLDFGQSVILAMLFEDFLRRVPPESRESIKRDTLAIWNGRMDESRKKDQEVMACNGHLSPEVLKKIKDSSEEAIARATVLFKGMIGVAETSK